jgi:Arc/MetJ family transcription regulator
MATEKVSLTLDREVVAAAREQVGPRLLSRYVNEALRHQLQRDRLTELLKQLEAEYGPIDRDALEEVRRAWPSPADEDIRRVG